MPAQEKLKQEDQLVALLVGLGVTIVIVAFILMGIGTIDSDDGVSVLLVGFAVMLGGVVFWLARVQPWKNFDDLTTPQFTGHHDEAHAEPVAAPVADAPAAPKPAPEPVAKAPAPKPAPAPVAKSPAPSTEPDDLTLIEGIGPKSAEALATAGITTYAQVAQTAPADLEKAIKDQKVRLVGNADTWPEQARLIGGGDPTQVKQYQDRIKGVTDAPEDDLTLLEGVGPKSAQALKTGGITTFAQVAQTAPVDLEKTIKDQKVRLVGSTETWPQQAELAAAGDLDGLKALQARIKGGVLQDE